MAKIFSQCDECNRDISVGEKMMTFSETIELIENESCTRPLSLNVIKILCEDCAIKAGKWQKK